MGAFQLALLSVIFLVSGAVCVVTGSTSLITVPAMLELHIEPRTALATNMFALTFMSLGAALPFRGSGAIDRRRLPRLTGLTLVGSVLGALLLLAVPTRSVSIIVPVAMIAVAIFSSVYRKSALSDLPMALEPRSEWFGYALTFVLGIYGGFFSGGYVTVLTAVFVGIFRTSFREAIATTKVLNVYSSAIATVVFICKGLVDYKLGIVLAVTMFIGASLGARFVMKIAEVWLRRIFLAAVWILGLKALLFDLWGHEYNGIAPRPTRP